MYDDWLGVNCIELYMFGDALKQWFVYSMNKWVVFLFQDTGITILLICEKIRFYFSDEYTNYMILKLRPIIFILMNLLEN